MVVFGAILAPAYHRSRIGYKTISFGATIAFVPMDCRVSENTPAEILSRAISPENGNLSRDAAESILSLSFPEGDRERMNELAEKARAGTLSDDDAAELENYRHVGRLLEILKSKARLSLQKNGVSG